MQGGYFFITHAQAQHTAQCFIDREGLPNVKQGLIVLPAFFVSTAQIEVRIGHSGP